MVQLSACALVVVKGEDAPNILPSAPVLLSIQRSITLGLVALLFLQPSRAQRLSSHSDQLQFMAISIENNEMLKDDDNSTTTDTNNNDSRPNSFYESQPSSEATTQAESYVKSIYKAKKRKKQQQATFNSFDREYIRDYLSLYRSQVLISHLSKEDEEESSGEAVRIAGHDFPVLNYK